MDWWIRVEIPEINSQHIENQFRTKDQDHACHRERTVSAKTGLWKTGQPQAKEYNWTTLLTLPRNNNSN